MRVSAQSRIIDIDVSRLIVLAGSVSRAFHVVQETRSGHVIQAVLVITAVRSVAARYPLVYSFVRVIRVVLLIVLRLIPGNLRRDIVILTIVIVQALVNIFLRLLLLLLLRCYSAIVIAYHVNWILIIRI